MSESIGFQYYWDTIKIFIATFLGFLISFLPQIIKKRKEEREIKKKFIQLYDAFRSSDFFMIFRVFKSVKMERINDVLSGSGTIWYEATKKKINSTITGAQSFSIKSEQFVLEKSHSNCFIRFDMYDRFLLFKQVGQVSYIFETKSKLSKDYNFFYQDKNQEILIRFLDYLEKQYRIHKIIREKQSLSKKININSRWIKNNLKENNIKEQV